MTTNVYDTTGRPTLAGRVTAAIYDWMNGPMERRFFWERRQRLLEAARGRVLEVGAGTGANLPHYPRDRIRELVLLDPGRPRVLFRRSSRRPALPGPDNPSNHIILRGIRGRSRARPCQQSPPGGKASPHPSPAAFHGQWRRQGRDPRSADARCSPA